MDNLPDQNATQGLPTQPSEIPLASVPENVVPDNQNPKKKFPLYLALIVALGVVSATSIIVMTFLKSKTQDNKSSNLGQTENSQFQQSDSLTSNTRTIKLAGIDTGNEYGKISRYITTDKIEWQIELNPLGFELPEGAFIEIWVGSNPEEMSTFTPLAKPSRREDGSYAFQIQETLGATNSSLNQFKNFVIMSIESVDNLSIEEIVARGEFQ